MALSNYFYNKTTRKYVSLFGSYFNQLKVCRTDATGTVVHDFIVPISYAPWQKVLSKVQQDGARETNQAIVLPRISFDITGIAYDAERKISPTRKMRKTVKDGDTGSRNFVYAGQPYNFEFGLYIMAKYNEDAIQLVEQIVPFFRPDLTNTATIIEGLDPLDIPLVLNDVTSEEIYEGNYEERQSILWTLNFTMKAWYFGPEREKKVIKFIDVDIATDTPVNTEFEENISLQPGLTIAGDPTTDITQTVAYNTIEFDDDYGLIRNIENPRAQEMVVTLNQSLMTSNTAVINVDNSGTYFTVDWGDGTNELTELADGTSNTSISHVYTDSGTYDVKIKFVDGQIRFDDSVVDIKWWGENTFVTAEEMFKGNQNLITFTASDVPKFQPGASTASMFEDCTSFTGANSNLSEWDFSNVTNTADMFKNTG